MHYGTDPLETRLTLNSSKFVGNTPGFGPAATGWLKRLDPF